jgi:hypothetical protein
MEALTDLYGLIAQSSDMALEEFTSLLLQATANVDPELTTIAQTAGIVSRLLPAISHGTYEWRSKACRRTRYLTQLCE